MIQLSRNFSLPEKEAELLSIKVIGVGGAGSNALDRVVLDGLEKADLIAMNTDVQSLASSVAARKVQLGRTTTRGLGAGGDPEIGYNAAFEAADEIRHELADARMVFICAGLGGGTGSGAAPAIAQVAQENGALVIAFATMPFTFEGKRRSSQANEALARLSENADAVICFDNDRMGDMVAPKAGVHQAFAAADITISQSIRSIVNLLQRPGLIRIGFDDLRSALRSANGRSVFGFGESDSDNRAHDALSVALKNPLMDRGRMLDDASHVLVQVAGGPGVTLSEVEILMREFNRHVNDRTQILFGTAMDARMGNRLSVTIISSFSTSDVDVPRTKSAAAKTEAPAPIAVRTNIALPEAELLVADQVTPAAPEEPLEAIPEVTPATAELIEEASDLEAETAIEPVALQPSAESEPEEQAEVTAAHAEPPPRVILPRRKPALTTFSAPKQPPLFLNVPELDPPKPAKPVREKSVQAKQETLQFEPITRGRFEKSEPTIEEGQDLDVPTFLRKNVRVK